MFQDKPSCAFANTRHLTEMQRDKICPKCSRSPTAGQGFRDSKRAMEECACCLEPPQLPDLSFHGRQMINPAKSVARSFHQLAMLILTGSQQVVVICQPQAPLEVPNKTCISASRKQEKEPLPFVFCASPPDVNSVHVIWSGISTSGSGHEFEKLGRQPQSTDKVQRGRPT